MSSLVVKLGSSIVADDRGEARLDVLGRICDELAELHRAGHEVVVVTSGAIAHGMGVMQLDPTRPDPVRPRPRAIDELQAAQRRRPGQALPGLRRAAARARRHERPGPPDVLRHERPDALPQRAPDAAQAARLARGPGHQRERHDHDRRDLVRQQRLPRGPGGDPVRRRSAGAADRRRGRVHRRPARRPRRPRWWTASRTSASSTRSTSATPPRRWARAACARRSSPPRWRPPRGCRP